jgi:FG-GAP-like repeat/FG-GAP repeat
VTADFNGDGKLDLVVLGTDSIMSDWNYSMLLGNGDGSFQSPVYYPQGVAAGSYSLQSVVADFNNDHKPDIALVTGNTVQPLAILLGNGEGTFATPVYYFDGSSANSLAVADFNSDGNLDIAVPAASGEGILYGKGAGTFQPIVFPASLNGFYASFTADINNDGKADLIGSQIALGNGNGTFTLLPGGPQNSVVGIADFNR